MDISLEHKINSLPKDLQIQLVDFIDFLISRRKQKTDKAQFDFSWEGGPDNIEGKYSSVELQHKARVTEPSEEKLSWTDTYKAMAKTEEDWSEWTDLDMEVLE
jgi:hypothetical protein